MVPQNGGERPNLNAISAVTTLQAAPAPGAGVHDVCFITARRRPDLIWVLNWEQLEPPSRP